MSTFATIGRAKEPSEDDLLANLDEAKLESAIGELMRESESINEDDPKQMAQLMRKLSAKAGLSLGDGMEEALARLEAGEDPEALEAEMGDSLEGTISLVPCAAKGKTSPARPPRPMMTRFMRCDGLHLSRGVLKNKDFGVS